MNETDAKRVLATEKKLAAFIKQNLTFQLKIAERVAKLETAVEKLKRAIPHVNFED